MIDCLICSYADAFPTDERLTAPRRLEKAEVDNTPSKEDISASLSLILQERDSLLLQLEDAKREIENLSTARNLDHAKIQKLKDQRMELRNVLDGKHIEYRDVLDSVFDW